MRIIEKNYINKPDSEQATLMEDTAIAAMVASIGDPYSRYMNRESFSEYQEEQKDTYIGLGISVLFSAETETLTVVAPYDGSPAQKAGVMPQDRIIEVDGIKTSTESYPKILEHLKGEGLKPDEAVRVTVERDSAPAPITLEMKRGEIAMDTVSTKQLGDGIGYLKISEFRNSTLTEFTDELNSLCQEDIRGLVIDLRNNPGGYAHIVLGITDTFVPKGELIAYSMKNNGARTDYRAQTDALDLPVVVLVNEGSASASELMAGSLQALGIGKLIGKKTFGKAVGQSSYNLFDGTNLYLTDSRYYTPLGNCIDGLGLTPDIEVDLTDAQKKNLLLLDPSEDAQLRTALDTLKTDLLTK